MGRLSTDAPSSRVMGHARSAARSGEGGWRGAARVRGAARRSVRGAARRGGPAWRGAARRSVAQRERRGRAWSGARGRRHGGEGRARLEKPPSRPVFSQHPETGFPGPRSTRTLKTALRAPGNTDFRITSRSRPQWGRSAASDGAAERQRSRRRRRAGGRAQIEAASPLKTTLKPASPAPINSRPMKRPFETRGSNAAALESIRPVRRGGAEGERGGASSADEGDHSAPGRSAATGARE